MSSPAQKKTLKYILFFQHPHAAFPPAYKENIFLVIVSLFYVRAYNLYL